MSIIMRLPHSWGGESIPAPVEETFNSATTTYLDVCEMDDTHCVVAYVTAGANALKAVCLTRDGNSISVGTPLAVFAAYGDILSICKVDSTHVVLAWKNTNDSKGYTVCIERSDTTLSMGSIINFTNDHTVSTGAYHHISVCGMSSTTVIAAYADANEADRGKAVCLTLSGTTLSAGIAAQFESGATRYIDISNISSSEAIVAYSDNGNYNYGTVCHLSLSGSTITPATPVVHTSTSLYDHAVCVLDSTHALVFYRSVSPANSYAKCITISGTTLTPSSSVDFASGSGNTCFSCRTITSTKAIIICRRDSTYYGELFRILLTDTTPSVISSITYNSAATGNNSNMNSVALFNTSRVIACYMDNGDSNHGNCIVVEL